MRSILLSGIFCIVSGLAAASAQQNDPDYSISRENVILSDSSLLLLEQLRHMPNIEVGNGITFRPRNNLFEVTMRFRMQNLLAMNFDDDFTLTQADARVKRLRLRFDGYIYSPKLVYSIQLGFTHYDSEDLPNGNKNIIRDAIVYYIPNALWNIGFGQTKIKANRARINSSSALQFVDRSIVNSEFNLDRDFGFFGEYNMRQGEGFNLSAKGSVTLGEGRNWGSSAIGGMELLKKRLANLLSVKSIVTLCLTITFCVLTVQAKVTQEFNTVYLMVIAFYFGTQNGKNAQEEM